jgi:gluconate 2-dehydrogenase gamma chain
MTTRGERQADDAAVVSSALSKEISRREAVQLLAAIPLATVFSLSVADQERAREFVDAAMEAGVGFAPKFFTAAEFRTVRILADMIIPRDDRSGSASDAGVPEFMDFIMVDRPNNQQWMRSGLSWIDAQAQSRFSKSFADATASERGKILDDIAWPARAPQSLADGVRFFNSFRDMTASGFWSSRIGVRDLQYIGNKFVPVWNGCPPAALRKLGVSYAKFDAKDLRLTPPTSTE